MRPGLILLAAAAVAGGCDEKLGSAVVDMALPPTPPYTAPAGVIHGKYLVEHLLFCGNCHTPTTPMGAPDTTKVLAGGRAFAVANGATTANIYAANITNDTATGLGGWTDDQIKSAITKGIDKDNKPLYPTMPYSTYSALNEVDLASIVLYLRTLSVANAVPENVAMPPAAASAALDDTDHVQKTRRNNASGLRFFSEAFQRLGMEFIPSAANFMLVRVGDGKAMFEKLQREGIIVRPMAG